MFSFNFILFWKKLKYYNPGQNIGNKIEKFSKTGQGKEILISTFACFLTAPKFDIFLIFPYFLRS